MEKKTVLSFLIQFVILFQAVGSLSETNSVASWDRHVRKKRVVDISPNRNVQFLNQNVRYVVPIQYETGEILCTGSILASRIILTAAHCVVDETCFVVSGELRLRSSKRHTILMKHVYESFNKDEMKHDLALLVLTEPIDVINSYHRAIELYNEETLPPNSHGVFTGWGRTNKESPYTSIPLRAQSMKVDIISLQECQHAYRSDPQIIITSHELCTYYIDRQRCCWAGDSGGPLVFNGRLVGVFSWYEKTGAIGYPDVFMNLLNSDYKNWVQNWVRHFHTHYPN